MEPIAIIGTGCRFPGAKNPEEFWQLLRSGADAITEVPADRWDAEAFYDPGGGSGKMNTRWGGFLEQVDQFDPEFFGIAPREAIYMDPQQRLLLEVAWEALENAGLVPEQLKRSATGVFAGISSSDYQQLLRGGYSQINAYTGTGNAFSIAANRLSYAFDFRGPSMAVDTACSSSLVAVHLACASLRSGECDLALAGGVNLLLSPELTVIFSQAQMMAPDGRCKTFDARANGYVRGEGCGIAVLKRLEDALRDGDSILALIKGSAINQDGRSNGLTAPNGPSQEAVIRQALAVAGVTPAQISYVELHGTGTAIGDPIEAEALGAVLALGRPPDSRCAVGSVKTNIGHLEAAAGIAGLIKLALSLQRRQIPPSLHFQQPNPYIPFDKLPLKVQQTLELWPETGEPARAGVSSFGFGGTNAHVILEEAPRAPEARLPDGEPQLNRACLLPLSARSPEALQSLARSYRQFLAASGTAPLADICHTASVRRAHHERRLSVVFHDLEELGERLEAFLQGRASTGLSWGQKPRHRRPQPVFVFSGQGPQWPGMGRELMSSEPVFRETLERIEGLLRPYTGWSLLAELVADESGSRLAETEIAQPAIFALQVALAALWRSWGIEPSAVVGHSCGEVAAAHTAGALSLEDAVRVIFHRSRLMQRGTGLGKMAAAELPLISATALLAGFEGRLQIAATNSPTSVVLSGEAAALEEVLQSLERQQISCRWLRVNYAFHSPQMEPFQEELVQQLQGIRPRAASIPIISTITGTSNGEDFDAAYWGSTIREPVRFAEAIDRLVGAKHDLFLELSPHPVLAANISQCLRHRHRPGTVLPSLRRQERERDVMLGSLGALYTRGCPVDWSGLYPSGKCVPLPSYPWQRARYWLEGPSPDASGPALGRVDRPSPLDAPLPATNGSANNSNAPIENSHFSKPAAAAPRLTKEQIRAAEPKQRRQVLESYLSELLAGVLGFSAAKIDLRSPLYSLGLDSLMAVEIRNKIEANLGVAVSLEKVLGLSGEQFIAEVLLALEEKNASPAAPVSPSPLWVMAGPQRQSASFRLFCFPYAGAGASIFRSWSEELPPEIEVCPVQLPGRENRLGESAFTRLKPLVQTLGPVLAPYLDIPFAFFGHSMGALLGFELARELRRQELPCPAHLFVSGRRAPQLPDLELPVHRLPDPEFLEALRRLNGTRLEVLQNPELMELFLPALRADFAILETYFYAAEEPLDCPVAAFGGLEDAKVSREDLAAWRSQTRREFTAQLFPGDHFFWHSHQKSLLQAIAQEILNPALK